MVVKFEEKEEEYDIAIPEVEVWSDLDERQKSLYLGIFKGTRSGDQRMFLGVAWEEERDPTFGKWLDKSQVEGLIEGLQHLVKKMDDAPPYG